MAIRVTYYAGGFNAGAPQQNRAELYDGAAGTYTSWSPAGAQTSQRALTAQETADLAATDTANTQSVNQGTVRTQAVAAFTTNRTYTALAAPSTAQNTAQVKALSQQMNGVLRMLLNQFDATN